MQVKVLHSFPDKCELLVTVQRAAHLPQRVAVGNRSNRDVNNRVGRVSRSRGSRNLDMVPDLQAEVDQSDRVHAREENTDILCPFVCAYCSGCDLQLVNLGPGPVQELQS